MQDKSFNPSKTSIFTDRIQQVPESTIDALTLTLSPYLKSSSQLLLTSILSNFLPFFLPLIPPTVALRLPLNQFLPPLLDRLNDPKERIHTLAASNVLILGKKAYEADSGIIAGMKGKEKENLVGFWERSLRDVLVGKGWRGKVEGMKVLLRMREEDVDGKFGLRPWIAPLVDLLEDGDGGVRDQAREVSSLERACRNQADHGAQTVIALLSPPSTPAAAKSELKKLLLTKNVRKTIADGILTRVLGGSTGASTPAIEVPANGESVSGSHEARSGAATPAVPGDDVEVVYVASGRDLDGEFAKMLPFFEVCPA
jgi:CLIP-associating protein 1/2